MTSLSCINNIFEPGNIGSSSGEIAPTPTGTVKFPITISGSAGVYGAPYGFAKKRGTTRFVARGYGASWGFGRKPTTATGDADDLLIILF